MRPHLLPGLQDNIPTGHVSQNTAVRPGPAKSAHPPKQTLDTITAVDYHIANIGLYPQPLVREQRDDDVIARTEQPHGVPIAPQHEVNAPPLSMPTSAPAFACSYHDESHRRTYTPRRPVRRK